MTIYCRYFFLNNKANYIDKTLKDASFKKIIFTFYLGDSSYFDLHNKNILGSIALICDVNKQKSLVTKCCSILLFAVPQSQLGFNLFLSLTNFWLMFL